MTAWIWLHHRCASLSLRVWLRQQAEAAGLSVSPVLDMHARPMTDEEVCGYQTGYAVVISGNGRYETVAQLDRQYPGQWLGVHIVRDPRDLLVSAYYSHRYSHPLHLLPELDKHRVRLNALPLDDGLQADLDFPITRQAIEAICRWPYDHPAILTLPYERLFTPGPLIGAPLLAACTWLGWPRPNRLDVPELRWGAVTGKDHRIPDTEAHYRSGVSGDWRTHFAAAPQTAAVFAARYGAALRQLGYDETLGTTEAQP